MLGQRFGEDDLGSGNGGRGGVVFDQVVEVGSRSFGVTGFQCGGAKKKQGGRKTAALLVVVFSFPDRVTEAEGSRRQGLGRLGRGEIFPGSRQIGFRITSPVQSLLEGCRSVGRFSAGTINPPDGNPGAGEQVAPRPICLLQQILEKLASLLTFSPGRRDFRLPVAGLDAGGRRGVRLDRGQLLLGIVLPALGQQGFDHENSGGLRGGGIRLFHQLPQLLLALFPLVFVQQRGGKAQPGLVGLGLRQGREVQAFPIDQSFLPPLGLVQGGGLHKEDPLGQLGRRSFGQGRQSLGWATVSQKSFGQ